MASCEMMARESIPVEEKDGIKLDGFSFSMRCNLSRHYEVTFVEDLLSPGNPHLSSFLKDHRSLLVTTPTVHSLYGEAFDDVAQQQHLDIETLIVACNEQQKSLDMVARVCAAALEMELGREDFLLALGGGICSDIVTVSASLIRRGIGHVRIPTTLVGQIDAGVGIKGAVNLDKRKSYLGCFHPPSAVLIDPRFLETLPQQFIRNGIAEIIKIAVIRDAELFTLLSQHYETLLSTAFQEPRAQSLRVLSLACRRMLEELTQNPYENQTYKRLVDMGHTFSPAVESSSNFAIPHGEAVAIDISLSSSIAVELGMLSETDYSLIIHLIESVGLPVFTDLITYDICSLALKESASHRGGSVNLVLPTGVGRAMFLERIDELPKSIIEAAIQRLARQFVTTTVGLGPLLTL